MQIFGALDKRVKKKYGQKNGLKLDIKDFDGDKSFEGGHLLIYAWTCALKKVYILLEILICYYVHLRI